MLLSLTLMVLGILLTGFALRQLIFKRKLIAASLNGFLGLVVLLVSTFVAMLLFNVQSYIQLTKEHVLAEVEIGAIDSGAVVLVLTINGEPRTYPISTDEWRVDARFIKWKPWVALLGKTPVVRLESLSGRNAAAGSRVIQVYNLHEDFQIIDKIITNLTDHFGMIDTMYGSSVYMPVEAGAHYQVSANHAGLIARPINQEGEQAIMQWDR
ncbi:MAG: hypothetical protein ABW080_04985 [Candidatus Thiodiazotropha sp.]